MRPNLAWRISIGARRSMMVALLFAMVNLLVRPALADTITNGNFETGTLASWTVFTTSNGTNGTGLPNVVSFNTTGGGASDAAHFNVGEVVFDMTQQGGGLSQTIMAPVSGAYTLIADFASQDGSTANLDAGTFSVIIDGTTVTTESLGAFSTGNQILRGSFDDSVNLAAGSHTFEFEITRGFVSAIDLGPDEYVDNISLTPSSSPAVPEPSSVLLLGSGLVAFAGICWRRVRPAVS